MRPRRRTRAASAQHEHAVGPVPARRKSRCTRPARPVYEEGGFEHTRGWIPDGHPDRARVCLDHECGGAAGGQHERDGVQLVARGDPSVHRVADLDANARKVGGAVGRRQDVLVVTARGHRRDHGHGEGQPGPREARSGCFEGAHRHLTLRVTRRGRHPRPPRAPRPELRVRACGSM